MEEPSVLDYVKSKLKFWQRGEKIIITTSATFSGVEEKVKIAEPSQPANLQPATAWPWRSLLALALASAGSAPSSRAAARSGWASDYISPWPRC